MELVGCTGEVFREYDCQNRIYLGRLFLDVLGILRSVFCATLVSFSPEQFGWSDSVVVFRPSRGVVVSKGGFCSKSSNKKTTLE